MCVIVSTYEVAMDSSMNRQALEDGGCGYAAPVLWLRRVCVAGCYLGAWRQAHISYESKHRIRASCGMALHARSTHKPATVGGHSAGLPLTRDSS